MKCLLLFCTGTMKHYSIGLWDAMKIGFYITISDDKLNFQTYRKLQSTSQSQTSTIKMVMVPVWWSAVGLIHYSFLTWKNHYIWEVCSANQWNALKTTRLQQVLINRKGPILLWDNTWLHVTQSTLQKLNELDNKVWPHLWNSPDQSSNDYHFFKHLVNTFFL